jgi:uncharacterized low-complexity protein
LRKTIALAIAGALTLALAAVALASPQFTYSFKTTFTQKHPNKSTGFKTDIETSDPGSTAPNHQPLGAAKIVVVFPKGTKFNQKALPQCPASSFTSADTACGRAKVGSGTSTVTTNSTIPGLGTIGANLTAFNIKGGILFFTKSTNASLPVTIPLKATVKRNKLTTDVASQIPSPGGLTSVITSFKLNIKAKGHGKKIYATTPKTCPKGGWVIKATVTFTDGTTKTYPAPASKCSKH